MTIGAILLIALLAIFVLIGIVRGAKKGFGRQTVSLIFDAIAILISTIITMPITQYLVNVLYDTLMTSVNLEDIGLSPEFIEKYGTTIVSMAIAPLCFLFVFLVIQYPFYWAPPPALRIYDPLPKR